MARNPGAANGTHNDDEGIANSDAIRYWHVANALPNVSDDFHKLNLQSPIIQLWSQLQVGVKCLVS
jgi:hypothetical protein